MIAQGDFAVLALGGAGCRMLSRLAALPGAEQLQLYAVDTDRDSLQNCGLPAENCLLAGELWRNGRGCGGNVLDGQRALSHERPRLTEMLSHCKFLVLTGGLGGGTATGGAAIVLSVASNLHLPSLCVFTLPFSQEGGRRIRTAEQTAANDILPLTDALITLPNDLLFSSLDAETPLAEAFQASDAQLARSVLALTAILSSGNLLNADFASFCGLLKRKKCRCALGVGVMEAGEADPAELSAQTAFTRMLSSPLLGGASVLTDADAVILTLLGGPELSLGNARELFTLASSYLGPHAEVLTGAAVNPVWSRTFQFTALAIRFDEPNNSVSGVAGRKGRHRKSEDVAPDDGMVQPDLPIDEVVYRRGIMEKTAPVRYYGEDLDIPTFQRRNLIIDTGKR